MIEYRPILFVIGILLAGLSVAMLIPAVVDLLLHDDDWMSFFFSAFLTAFVGANLIFATRGQGGNLTLKQAFILTTLSWISIAAFAALPFVFSKLHLSYTDAFFEAMSGITTTGASVLTGLDTMPAGILVWRSLLTGLGGIGIIVFAMAVLPMLKIGGMQLFRTESSTNSDKIMPRMTQISMGITIVYALLVISCAISFWLAGMSAFDAITHSFPTIATAGFSTHDASFAFFNSMKIDYVTVFFMAISGMPFVLFIQFLRGDRSMLWKDEQVRWYLAALLVSTAMVTTWTYFVVGLDFFQALRHSSFTVTSLITTTGFASTDYSVWGSFIDTFIFLLLSVGGCTGSTSGGIKIFRFQILYKTAKTQLLQLIQPHAIVKMRYNGKTVSENITASVMSFIILYGFSFMLVAVILSMTGLDFISSMTASAASLSNTGPGMGNILGPVGNYSSVHDVGKWTLSFAMLLGRLEIFTILVLLTVKFWKD